MKHLNKYEKYIAPITLLIIFGSTIISLGIGILVGEKAACILIGFGAGLLISSFLILRIFRVLLAFNKIEIKESQQSNKS